MPTTNENAYLPLMQQTASRGGGIDPAVLLLADQLARQRTMTQPAPAPTPAPIPSETVQGLKIKRQMQDMDQRQSALQNVNPGLGRWAPLAGVLKGLASNYQRGQDNATLEERYAAYQKMEEQKAAQAAAEKQAAMQAQAQAEQAKYERDRRDAEADDARKQAEKIAFEQWKRDHPMPMSPEEQLALKEAGLNIQKLQRDLSAPPPPSFEEKEDIKVDKKRLGDLAATAAGRHAGLEKAKYFRDAFDPASGQPQMNSGATRTFAGYIPGVFTDQAKFDEEFKAFAETAARARLKASGEIRPTDADVEGMKQAMFGVGRDESVNLKLLNDYINEQQALESEYQRLSGGKTPTGGVVDWNDLP